LSEPHCAEYLRMKAARAVALGAGSASARLVGLLDAKSEHVSADVVRHVLAIAGIKSTPDAHHLGLNVSISCGYVIDLSEPTEDERATRAKPVNAVPQR
jgi:hypothetical protein